MACRPPGLRTVGVDDQQIKDRNVSCLNLFLCEHIYVHALVLSAKVIAAGDLHVPNQVRKCCHNFTGERYSHDFSSSGNFSVYLDGNGSHGGKEGTLESTQNFCEREILAGIIVPTLKPSTCCT